MPIDSPFLAFLEEMPEAGYFSFQNQFGRSPNQKRYFQNQFREIQNRYVGDLGQQIRGGGQPTMQFMDYLDEFFGPQGGAAQEWGSMSPRQRGVNLARFSPPTRWFR